MLPLTLKYFFPNISLFPFIIQLHSLSSNPLLRGTMSNSYGFDFLRAEHNLPNKGTPITSQNAAQSTSLVAANNHSSNKSLLEKQADILLFLRHHRSSGCLPPYIVQKSLGINLLTDPVAELLQKNPKIIVEEVPDPENPSLSILYYGYRAKFSGVKDKVSLVGQINRSRYGVKWGDLVDAYDGVEKVCWNMLLI